MATQKEDQKLVLLFNEGRKQYFQHRSILQYFWPSLPNHLSIFEWLFKIGFTVFSL